MEQLQTKTNIDYFKNLKEISSYCKDHVSNLINSKKEDAIDYIRYNKLNYRIIKEDNNNITANRDLIINRINLIICNDKVIDCYFG